MLGGQDNAYHVGRASKWGVSNQHRRGKCHRSHGDQLCTDFTGKENIPPTTKRDGVRQDTQV